VTIGTLLDELAETLGPAGLPARGEARDLVAAVLDRPRFWPTAHRADPAEATVVVAARAAAARRRAGMPFAYAVGTAAFRGLTLAVDPRVLIPRPETELLVDLVLAAQPHGALCVDVGTGSGAIALALAAEGRHERVIGTDVSADALAVATANRGRVPPGVAARVEFRLGSGVAPVAGERAAVVVSNPPYIAPDEVAALPAAVRDWEPPLALVAGDGGMAVIAAVIRDAAAVLGPHGLLALEVDSRRAEAAADLVRADAAYRDVLVRQDLTGRDRFVLARRTEA
jgi:release factor glutamine methyltransferase